MGPASNCKQYQMEILTVTINPAIDVGVSIEALIPSRKIRSDSPRHDPGGGGINVTRAARRFGIDSQALICSGGATGILLLELLAKEHIHPEVVPINGSTRENITIFVSSERRHYRIVTPGPTLTERDWQAALARISTEHAKAAYVVASGSLPPGVPVDLYARMARIVNKAGGRFIADTSGDALHALLKEKVFMIKPSLREVKQILSLDPNSNVDAAELSRDLLAKSNCELVAVSLGESGAIGVWQTGGVRLRAPKVQARSSVGAGDSMVAGILAGLVRKWAFQDALAYGVAAGSAAVLAEGTTLCSQQDTEKLYAMVEREELK